MPTGDVSFPTEQPSPSVPPTPASNGHTAAHNGTSIPARVNGGRRASASTRRTAPPAAKHAGPAHRAGTATASVAPSSAVQMRQTVSRMRDEACARARPLVQAGAAPIRVMARMVAELEAALREASIPEATIAETVVNRTIGDVDMRRISAELDGPEYVSLADEMGIALPGEVIGGYTATGDTYHYLHTLMLDFERELLARRFDLRLYDLPGTGNPILRQMLSDHALRHWGYTLPPQQIYLSLGALDGLDKFFRGWSTTLRASGKRDIAVIFPAPGFNVPEWQVESLGMRLHRMTTRVEDNFKITPRMLAQALDEAPDIRAIYLTVSNNPTAFSYTPAELRALCDMLLACEREVLIVADLAYIGTGAPEEDHARMAELRRPGVYERTVFVSSFSKTHTVTGDRCGWVGFGDARFAAQCGPGWTNSTASLPAEWQLRYMANLRLFAERPELAERIRALYHHRRGALVRQLQRLNTGHELFAHINLDDGGTVYNWSQLQRDQDVFSLFSATGIAGVPGSAFGYSDDFVRLSVGCIPVPAE
jgi:aspartate/methionine/tyrosine aminotransferase